MNEGWCWADGESYTESIADTLMKCRIERKFILDAWLGVLLEGDIDRFSTAVQDAARRAVKGTDTNNDLLWLAYHAEYVYWTDWYDEEYTAEEWYTHDGKYVDGNELLDLDGLYDINFK